MSLFPTCRFELFMEEGTLTAGGVNRGQLRVVAPQRIERAEHLFICFRTQAVAGYGSGKNRSVLIRDMLVLPFRVDLPPGGLPAGEHRYPVDVHIPDWLPPNFSGPDCSVRTVAEVRLDVDWAIDPTSTIPLPVRLRPRVGQRTPISLRSPLGFHESVTLELSLASTGFLPDEGVRGTVLLRSGHESKFDAVVLAFVLGATVHMGRGDVRTQELAVVRIPKAALLGGAPVPFFFPPNTSVSLTTALNSYLAVRPQLSVSLDVPWAFDPSFSVPLDGFPPGSQLHDVAGLGSDPAFDRLQRVAAETARATGLSVGRSPCLVVGSAGMVRFAVYDSPRGGRVGAMGSFSFPDLDLGLDFHPVGLLEGFRGENLLPPSLERRYVLRSSQSHVPRAQVALAFASALSGLEDHVELHLTNHELQLRTEIAQDDARHFAAFAKAVHERAKLLDAAFRQMPFPAELAAFASAWTACARAEGATLLPHAPALFGVERTVRLAFGEPRCFRISLSTVWRKSGPSTRLDLGLADLEIPKNAEAALAQAPLAAVRARFSSLAFGAGGHLFAERDGISADPADLLVAADGLVDFFLELRGDRRVDAPYR